MKYIKHIILSLILLTLSATNIYADCYYSNSDNKVLIRYDSSSYNFVIERRGGSTPTFKKEKLINQKNNFNDSETGINVTSVKDDCPTYIVYRHKSNLFQSDGIFGFDNLSEAQNFSNMSNEVKKINAWVVSKTTQQNYEQNLPKAKKGNTTTSKNASNTMKEKNANCNIFGDKSDPNSLKSLIDDILQYPKIIVPIIVIGMGSLDLAKAAISSKQEDMKKAQNTFIKRIIIGAAFFLIPLFMDIIMWLADIVWNGLYPICKF